MFDRLAFCQAVSVADGASNARCRLRTTSTEQTSSTPESPGLQRRQKAEEQRGEYGNHQREQKDAPIRRRADYQRNIGGRTPSGQHIGNPQRQERAARPAQNCDDPGSRSTTAAAACRAPRPRPSAARFLCAGPLLAPSTCSQIGAGQQQDQARDSEQRRGESNHRAANVVPGQARRR
jgi:hypothetical protein